MCIRDSLLSLVYLTLHSLSLLFMVALLDAALQEGYIGLFALLVLVQFAEIKSTVLKDIKEKALYEMCLEDVMERFQLLISLACLFLYYVTFSVAGLDEEKDLWYLAKSIITIYLSEVAVDWIKHTSVICYTPNSNHVYARFGFTLSRLAVDFEKTNWLTERSRPVATEIGFSHSSLAYAVMTLHLVRYCLRINLYENIVLLIVIFCMLWIIYKCNGYLVMFFVDKYAVVPEQDNKPVQRKKPSTVG
eukprot:TRINITY_DN2369_c0_g1_i1.p1 TRINITY_DN2369_c0_g1~~TRINITY_DN2369_c0_g1_i1.p1  ORF type:complete len:247 (-),score=14.61 TRINITY_DN2369_c0_g1_i1:259-999(-)